MFWDILSYIGWGLLWLFGGILALVATYVFVVVPLAFLVDWITAKLSYRDRTGHEWWSVKRKGPGRVHLDQDSYTPRNGKQHAFVSVPGILAKENHIVPLMPALDQYDVTSIKYAGLRYDREILVHNGVAIVRFLLQRYHVVVLDGISHGGHGVAHIMEALEPKERARIDVLLHDVPWGAETLKQVPGFAARYFLLTPGRAANFFLGFVPKLFAMGGPKQETVWTPNVENMFQLSGVQLTPAEYFDWVVRNAKRDLSGHTYAMWHSEIGDMVRGGMEGLPTAGLNGAKSVTYIAYVPDSTGNDKINEVIAQPAALNKFANKVPLMRVIRRYGTHAGFWDDVDGNLSALSEALPE